MNYTDLIECLFRFCECKGLSANARICVLTLFHHWKRKGCPDSFKMPSRAISERINATSPTVLSGIRELEKTGIIKVKRGGPRVPNEYKVMLNVMVKELSISGVMLNLYTIKSLPLYNTNNIHTNTNINKNKEIKGSRYNSQSANAQQVADNSKQNKLSIWKLDKIKAACEQELKDLRIKGYEDAWGFHYANKDDRAKAKELKAKLKNLNKRIMEADS